MCEALSVSHGPAATRSAHTPTANRERVSGPATAPASAAYVRLCELCIPVIQRGCTNHPSNHPQTF